MSVLAPKPSLYERLPEIYRQRDAEGTPPGQLYALIKAIASVMGALAGRIGAQYDDLFIETCDDWVIPYLADLVGTSHLKGDAWTLRADVARTVRHRRRKGTLGAVESQVHALSQWAVHAVELRERLAWNQPLNHLRPDAGGKFPFRLAPHNDMRTPVRGGTAALRAPAWLSFVGGPFDPYARTADVKPPLVQSEPPIARAAVNLPNLGVFVWRLADFQTPVSRPSAPRAPWSQVAPVSGTDAAKFAVRFELHPQAEPMVLFNTHRFRADAEPPNLATADGVPGPMPRARLNSDVAVGRPAAYVKVAPYEGGRPKDPTDDEVGLVLHVPKATFPDTSWKFRGANLCAWETSLNPKLRPFEIAVDPVHGRVVFGVTGADAAAQAQPLAEQLFVSTTTGFSGAHRVDGSVGAQPVPRLPERVPDGATLIKVDGSTTTLGDALTGLADRTKPLIVEITNSDTHVLDVGVVRLPLLAAEPDAGSDTETKRKRVYPLTIRAASGQRPVIRLVRPLRLRPKEITDDQAQHARQNVRLHGLYLTRAAGFPAGRALIEQAVLNRLEIDGCTLDPGGARLLDGSAAGARTPLRTSLRLTADRGLSGSELDDFKQTPQIVLRHTVCGTLAIDRAYLVALIACIVDAGAGVADPAPGLAIRAATGSAQEQWAAPIAFDGVTVFGRARVERARGEGGIFVHRLEVYDNQDSHTGPLFSVRSQAHADDILALFSKPGSCIKASYFSGDADRLPQHFACVVGTGAVLRFTAEIFGAPGYAQLSARADRRIREEGPDADEMGAFGFLRNAHKWRNIGIRLREFMPAGMRALLIPVT
ncbi:phage tail protein [Piscinibacter sp.]|uniref:phage tail protein n=1 Tax=Piscinibacter sp. TaxID=1903157 RepID=UPI002BB3E7F1|nr:phage tail protein [Albitalea sp.]HUG25731.1 phage tail protein [Albitalea sp.]